MRDSQDNNRTKGELQKARKFSDNPFAKKYKATNDAKARTRALASHIVKASIGEGDRKMHKK